MHRAARFRVVFLIAGAAILLAGCTSPCEYIRNGFKVGPNAGVPQGTAAPHWIEASDVRVRSDCAEVNRWWAVFQDPVLTRLIYNASRQNLSLREACFRVLEARAQLGISKGNLFPQSQSMGGSYQRIAASQAAGTAPGYGSQFFDQWGYGFNLSWELDFWGRFRRAIAAAEDTLEASCSNYDDVLVTLLGDVATNYVQVRTLQQRIQLVRANVELQSRILSIADAKLKAGAKNALDSHQALSNLNQTESQVPQLQIQLRQTCDRLCVLLGMPTVDLEKELGAGPIPTAPVGVAIGIPCDLLRRRPDVRRAQWQAHAQGEQIGIAEAALYPAFLVNGTIGYQAQNFPQLFGSDALTGSVGPAFQWNILNYGRIRNNIRAQDAAFWALVAAYQNTVLRANAEAEDGLAMYLRSQERAKLLDTSVIEAQRAVDIVAKEYNLGTTDFNRVALITQTLVQQQDLQAQAHGDISAGLVQLYRALGGGWEMPPTGDETVAAPAAYTEPMAPPPLPSESPKPPAAPSPPAPLPRDSVPVAPLPREPLPVAPLPSEVAPATSVPTAPLPPETNKPAAKATKK